MNMPAKSNSIMYFTLVLGSILLSVAVLTLNFYETARASDQSNISVVSQTIQHSLIPDTNSDIYLPYVSRQANVSRTLGTVTVLSGPVECDAATNQFCYDIQVTCQEVSADINATLKIGEPTGQEYKGTIMFFSGATGMYFWDESTFLSNDSESAVNLQSASILDDIPTDNPLILANLRNYGYRTAQIKWKSNWYQAQLTHHEGMAKLACRSASVARWVYDHLHVADASKPFCATGHSNGATQVSYMLTHYGLGKILSATVLESGPNWSYIEYACLQDNPAYTYLFARDFERKNIDMGFGFKNDGSGPCNKQDANWRTSFQEASVISASGTYTYPNTLVAFLFGEQDTGTTAKQGKEFYNRLVLDKTPWLNIQTIAGAGHDVTNTPAGRDAMENLLKNECIIR